MIERIMTCVYKLLHNIDGYDTVLKIILEIRIEFCRNALIFAIKF